MKNRSSHFSKKLISIAAFLFLLTPLTQSQDINNEDWIQIFNGKDIDNWKIKFNGYELGDNYKNTFVAEDGMIRVKYDNYDTFSNQFGHLFYEQPFSYYRLRIQYRFIGDQVPDGPGWAFRNNGIMMHSQSPESMGLSQDFPISIEVQLLGGNGKDERSTLNLCTPGTHVTYNDELLTQHCFNSKSKTYHGDQWVNAEITILGDSIIHHVIENDTILTYTNPVIGGGNVDGHDEVVKIDGQLLSEGYIAIQAESHSTDFRKIELLNLKGCMDPKARNYKAYYLKGDRSECVY